MGKNILNLLEEIKKFGNEADEEDIFLIGEALKEARDAMFAVVEDTGGYTGGKPQEWLKRWCNDEIKNKND